MTNYDIKVVYDDACRTIPRRECMQYNKTVCAMIPEREQKLIMWENQRLEKLDDKDEEKCETVKRCNFTMVNMTEEINEPRQVCENTTRTQNICNQIPYTEYRVSSELKHFLIRLKYCFIIV